MLPWSRRGGAPHGRRRAAAGSDTEAEPPDRLAGRQPPGGRASRDRQERPPAWILVALTAMALAAWMGWSTGSERRAIARMPAEQRRVIYEHTLETVRTLCRDPEPGMRARCREQAEFLTAFPECDDACRLEIAPFLRKPAR